MKKYQKNTKFSSNLWDKKPNFSVFIAFLLTNIFEINCFFHVYLQKKFESQVGTPIISSWEISVNNILQKAK